MENTSTKKSIPVKEMEDVNEGNGLWPYRVVENDRITYFQSKKIAMDYYEKSDGNFEFYVLPRWYNV